MMVELLPQLNRSWLRGLWRRALSLRVRLWDRRRYDRLTIEKVGQRPLLILPQVFNPKLLRTGQILAETLDETLIPPGSQVLDMGTGSGIGAIFAAQFANRVTAVDINPHAVRCAQINVLLNGLQDRVTVSQSDLFTAVPQQRFDVILFNPPYYRGHPQNPLDHAWRAEDTVERFAQQLPEHLTTSGSALLVLSTDGDLAGFLHTFSQNGLTTHIVTRRDLINEIVTIYRLTI